MDSVELRTKQNPSKHRLGDSLLAEGLLNRQQLDEAIEYQCIYGGKLGTSLIELALITEEQLSRVLSRELKLHYIKPELLMEVATPILKLIPKEIALKHKIVPYHKDGKKLYVAMKDITDLAHIDNLSFQLDHVIIPLAIPEVRLMLALKKHYGLILSPRFETLAGQINMRNLAAQKSKHPPETKTQCQINHPDMEENQPWPLLGDEEYEGEEATDESYFAGMSSTETRDPVNLRQKLADAKGREDIAAAIITYLKNDFPDSALLMVRGNLATGWLSGSHRTAQNFEQITIQMQESSVFNMVATSRSYYLGPVTDSLQNQKILNYFNSSPPVDALVFPLKVKDRLVSILYIQGRYEDLQNHLPEVKSLVTKAEMSFKLLILRNKILMS